MQVPDIIDNAYVIVEFDNGCRGMLDLCMFAEGSKNEQEISVVGDIGKVEPCFCYFNFRNEMHILYNSRYVLSGLVSL
jgi:hypothetical protein